jgi:hypothetical protein
VLDGERPTSRPLGDSEDRSPDGGSARLQMTHCLRSDRIHRSVNLLNGVGAYRSLSYRCFMRVDAIHRVERLTPEVTPATSRVST